MNLFSLDWHVYALLVVLWVLTIVVLRRKGNGEFLSKLFSTNKDLDTTLDQILKMATVAGVFLFAFAMVFAFHDEIANNAALALLLSNVVTMITIMIRDMFPAGAKINGQKKDGNTEERNGDSPQ